MSKRDQYISNEALFRLSVIWQVETHVAMGQSVPEAINAVVALEHSAFDGRRRHIKTRSLYRWLKSYGEAGTQGLEPASRPRASESKVLSRKFIDFAVCKKKSDPSASIPELIRQARELGIINEGDRVDRSTVYRTFLRLGVSVARRKSAKERDARRFAFSHRLDMVLCDGKHFRAGVARLKRVALFFIDDATRYLLHTVVGSSESTALFLRGLYECICKHGHLDRLYLDHGPGFIAKDTAQVVGNLKCSLIHGEVRYPEGHGKVERFNQTAKNDVLRGLDGRPDVDAGCSALELRLQHYTDTIYNHRPHESLGGQTPGERYFGDPKPLRFPEDQDSLRHKFEVSLKRRVSNDSVVSIDGVFYDMPRGYAGQQVILRRRLLLNSIGFIHDGKVIDLCPCDQQANANTRRATPSGNDHNEQVAMPQKTAADYAFEREFRSVVDADGGFESPGDDIFEQGVSNDESEG